MFSSTSFRSVVQLTSGLLKSTRSLSNTVQNFKKCSDASRQLQVNGSFTRSMRSLCSKRPTGISSTQAGITGNAAASWNKTCGCCALHTRGDEELAEFLREEIDQETRTAVPAGKMPNVRDFKIHHEGSEITLTKEKDGETITIEMNINHSVQDASGTDYDGRPQGQETDAAEMVARPPFTVKISKGGDLTLAIQCDFPDQDGYQPAAEGQEDYVDAIEITEVAVLRGEWNENVYSVSGSVMDGNLYDMLMNMMEERGVTGDCIDQIIEYATAYDQQKYIKFLEDLQSFANAK